MKRMVLATVALGALALVSSTALAQSANREPRPHALRADADADGRISRDEFVQARVVRLTAVDANRDGSVSAEELRSGIDTRRNQRISTRFETADTDGNGALSREEFLAARPERGERAGRSGRGGEHRGWHGARAGAAGRGARGPVMIADVETRMATAFARMDKDGDGFVTPEERRAAWAEMRQTRQARRAERMANRTAASPSPSTAPSE